MAEIIGIFGTISAFASLAAQGLQLAKTVNLFVKEVKGAEKEAQLTADEIRSTVVILEQFTVNLELENKIKLCLPNFYSEIDNNIADCRTIFVELQTVLNKAAPGVDGENYVFRKRDAFLWPFIREDIVSLQRRLVRVKTNMQLQMLLMGQTHQVQIHNDARKNREREASRDKRATQIKLKMFRHQIEGLKLQESLAQESLLSAVFSAQGSVRFDSFDLPNPTQMDSLSSSALHPQDSQQWQEAHQQRIAKLQSEIARRKNDSLQGLDDHPLVLTGNKGGDEQKSPNNFAGPTLSLPSVNFMHEEMVSASPERLSLEALPAKTKADETIPSSDLKQDLANPQSNSVPESMPQSQPLDSLRRRSRFPMKWIPSVLAGQRKSPMSELPVVIPQYSIQLPKPAEVQDQKVFSPSAEEPPCLYESWMLSRRYYPDIEWILTFLHLTSEETLQFVKSFRSKKKLVYEQFPKLPSDAYVTISKKLEERVTQGNQQRKNVIWSIIALKLYPKRAQGSDVESAQVVFRQAPVNLPDLAKSMQRDVGVRSTSLYPSRFSPVNDILLECFGELQSFSWDKVRTKEAMQRAISQTFDDPKLPFYTEIFEGYYDLVGPTGEVIGADEWVTTVRPGYVVTMQLWPIARQKQKNITREERSFYIGRDSRRKASSSSSSHRSRTSKVKTVSTSAAPLPPLASRSNVAIVVRRHKDDSTDFVAEVKEEPSKKLNRRLMSRSRSRPRRMGRPQDRVKAAKDTTEPNHIPSTSIAASNMAISEFKAEPSIATESYIIPDWAVRLTTSQAAEDVPSSEPQLIPRHRPDIVLHHESAVSRYGSRSPRPYSYEPPPPRMIEAGTSTVSRLLAEYTSVKLEKDDDISIGEVVLEDHPTRRTRQSSLTRSNSGLGRRRNSETSSSSRSSSESRASAELAFRFET